MKISRNIPSWNQAFNNSHGFWLSQKNYKVIYEQVCLGHTRALQLSLASLCTADLKVQYKALVIKWADSQEISVCIVVFSEEQDDIIPEAITLDY